MSESLIHQLFCELNNLSYTVTVTSKEEIAQVQSLIIFSLSEDLSYYYTSYIIR